MYTYDTTLYCCCCDIKSDNKEKILNNELQRVYAWLNANKLSLNVRKTKYMTFRKYENNDIWELNLLISDDNIEHVNEFNFGHSRKYHIKTNYKSSWHGKKITIYRRGQVSQLKAYFCNRKEKFELVPLLAIKRILNHYSKFITY